MSAERFFSDSDIHGSKRYYNWKEQTGEGPEDSEDTGISRSSGFFSVSLSGRSALSRAERLLAGIPGGLKKAVQSASARIETHLKSSATKAAAERYAVSQVTIRKEENVSVSYSFSQGAQVTIIFSGEKIPLFRFSGASPSSPAKDMSRRVGIMLGSVQSAKGEDVFRWRLVHPSLPARGHALNSTAPYQFRDAFVARFKSGHTGIFERTGGVTSRDKDEIQELYGPSVPQMLGNDEVANKVIEDTMETFDKRMEHEITRLLNGWGS